MAESGFSAVDYVVFAASLLIALGIGVWSAWKRRGITAGGGGCLDDGGRSQISDSDEQEPSNTQHTAADELVRSKGMSLIPVALSLLASFQSAILIVGSPAEVYAHGAEWTLNVFGMMLGIAAASVIFVPVLYRLDLTSIYQYFELRYGGYAVRAVAAAMAIIYMLLYMGMALYAPVVALSFMTGFPQWAAILLAGSICTIYTSVGGLRGVILTDVFQSVVIFGSMLTVFIYGTSKVGGPSNVFETCAEFNRTNFFDFSVDPYERQSVWTIVSNMCFSWMFVIGATQASYQRFAGMGTLAKAKQAVLINIPANMVLIFLANFTGFILFATYAYCDPILTGEIERIDQILPHFVMEKMSHLRGLPGLFAAGLFGGGLSTMSSGLNAMASVAWEDGIRFTRWGKSLSPAARLNLLRFLGLGFGSLAIAIAFMSSTLGDIVQVNITLSNTFSAPLLTMFLVSILFPFVTRQGVVTGACASFAVVSWIAFGAYASDVPGEPPLPSETSGCDQATFESMLHYSLLPSKESDGPTRSIYNVSYLLYIHFGLAAGIVVSVVVSLLTGGLKTAVSNHLTLHPLALRLFKMSAGKKADENPHAQRSHLVDEVRL